jgi:hypothetical protein
MSETASRPEKPIPVFSISHLGGVQRAAHPDYKKPMPADDCDEIRTRVGSAWRRADGSYVIQLVAVPVNGLMVLEPHASATTARE